MSKKTIVVDIETRDAVTATAQAILNNITGGISYGTMNIFSSGRQTGKTMHFLKKRYYDPNPCKEILLPMYPEPKYKFSRARWYEARISTDAMWRLSNGYNDIIAWCTEQFGKHPAKPDAWSRWRVGIGFIYFRDEADYILYQLKWS